jgi:shikimate kinase
VLRPRVVLIGPAGSGKTTIGSALAARLNTERRDTDEDIETSTGRTIGELFVDEGEEHFRALEKEAVSLALTQNAGVVSLGGGAVLADATQGLLRDYTAAGGTVVFLDVSAPVALRRVGLAGSRPLLTGGPRQRWGALMDERRPLYESLATRVVNTDRGAPGAIAASIAEELS